jgi:cytochrome c oxidase assembly factor CtaG
MHYLLTAHMVQHMFFSVICPPLLLLGMPEWLLEPLFRRSGMRRGMRFLTHPVVAFGLYNLTMWLWHLPALVDAQPPGASTQAVQVLDNALLVGALVFAGLALLPRLVRVNRRLAAPSAASALALVAILALVILGTLNLVVWGPAAQPHNPLHTLMDALFICIAILYWWPILSPVRSVPRVSPGIGMLYMVISTQPMMALGALITFAARPLYQRYLGAPPLWGFSRIGDQQLAGLIMWLPMGLPR